MSDPVTLIDAALVGRGVDPINKLDPAKRLARRIKLRRHLSALALRDEASPAARGWLLDNMNPPGDPAVHQKCQEMHHGA